MLSLTISTGMSTLVAPEGSVTEPEFAMVKSLLLLPAVAVPPTL